LPVVFLFALWNHLALRLSNSKEPRHELIIIVPILTRGALSLSPSQNFYGSIETAVNTSGERVRGTANTARSSIVSDGKWSSEAFGSHPFLAWILTCRQLCSGAHMQSKRSCEAWSHMVHDAGEMHDAWLNVQNRRVCSLLECIS
jgi:hypothetical protein